MLATYCVGPAAFPVYCHERPELFSVAAPLPRFFALALFWRLAFARFPLPGPLVLALFGVCR
jgi:hypothetical protein